MKMVPLSGTDLRVSEIVLGTMTFGGQVNRDDSRLMVNEALDAGITMFDTSNNYASGDSERFLGAALGKRRDDIVLATKGGSTVDQQDQSLAGLSQKALVRAVEGSLERLGTDRIDVYYLHRPDRDTSFDETLEAIRRLVESGKVRTVGQSNFAAWQITELNALARASGGPSMLVSQPMYSLLGRRIETEYSECSAYLGLTNITYNPLAGGLLTGKHGLEEQPEPGSRFSREIYRDRYWSPELFAAVDRLKGIADAAGVTLIELSLRWVLQQPLADCMLLGASSVDQLRANLAAANGADLTPDVLDACDRVWADLAGPAPLYNR